MSLVLSELIPYSKRDANWQFLVDYNYPGLSIHCIEIKPSDQPIYDDARQPPEKLRKVTLIYSYPGEQGELTLIMVLTKENKSKDVFYLHPESPNTEHDIASIVRRISDANLEAIFSTLKPRPSQGIMSSHKWTMLEVYDPIISEYYQLLHEQINHYLETYFAKPGTPNILHITEVGCGFSDALRLVLESLPPQFEWLAHGVDLNERNIAEARNRTFNHPNVTFTVDDFLDNKSSHFFARIYPQQAKAPHTLRIIISSGGMSVATVPTLQQFLFFFQQAHQYEIDLLIFGSITAISWHQPLLKKLGYRMTVEASSDDIARPLYILHRIPQSCLFNSIATTLYNNDVHLNLHLCHTPIKALTDLTSEEKEQVVSIDLSYCALTAQAVVDLEQVFLSFRNLRSIIYRSLLDNFVPPENNRGLRWQWILVPHTMQDTVQNYFYRKKQVHNKFLVFQGFHTQCDILPNINHVERRAIIEGYNRSNLGPQLSTDTCNAFELRCYEQQAAVYPLLILVLIERFKMGYLSVNEQIPLTESGYVAKGALTAHFNYPGEFACYKSLHQRGFFSAGFLHAIVTNRVGELEEELAPSQASFSEEDTEYQAQLQEALALYREAF